MITVENLTKTFGHKKALDGIEVKFEKGITGLLGPNGAGKSTLMRILATIDKPTSGTVCYGKIDIKNSPNELRQVLGYLPQGFGVYPNMNASEFLEYMAAMKSLDMKTARQRIRDLLEVLGLSDVGKKYLGGFSGGMKQRVGIAQALLNDPDLLILDEPTVGLDPLERISFHNLLTSLASNRTIILSTHIVSDIESIAPNIVILQKGQLLAMTTPEKLITKSVGKVWSTVTSPDNLENIQSQFIISNSMQKADGLHLRIISDMKPCLNAEPVEPSLEDGYLNMIDRAGAMA